MKRPLGVVGFCFFAALVLAARVDWRVALAGGGVWLLAAGVSLCIRALRTEGVVPAGCFAAAAACLMTALTWQISVAPALTLADGEPRPVTAVVETDFAERGDSLCAAVRMTAGDPPQTFRAELWVREPLPCDLYDELELTASLRPVETAYRSSRLADGIVLTASARGEITVRPTASKPPAYWLAVMRRAVAERIDHALSDPYAAVVKGVTLGGSAELPADVSDTIRAAGVSHMFAVSGLHIAVMGQLLIGLLTLCGVRRRRAPAWALGILWVFIGICGFPPSALRAGIMFSLYALGLALFADADPLNSLGTALLLIALPNPYCGLDTGLLLSAAATLGILLLARPMTDRLTRRSPRHPSAAKLWRGAAGLISVSMSATLFTAPVLMLTFGQLALYGIAGNLLLFFAPNILLFCTPPAVLLALAGLDFIAAPLFLADGLTARLMLAVSGAISRWPGALLLTDKAAWRPVLAACLILIALCLILGPHRPRLRRLTAVLCAVLLLLGGLTAGLQRPETVTVTLAEDAAGVSALVRQGDHAALIGCGSRGNTALRRLLNTQRVTRLDAVVLPTLEEPYAGGLTKVWPQITTGRLLAPEAGTLRPAAEGLTPSVLPLDEAGAALWPGVSVRREPDGAVILTAGGDPLVFLPGGDGGAAYALAVTPGNTARGSTAVQLLTHAASGPVDGREDITVYAPPADGSLRLISCGNGVWVVQSTVD